MRFSKERARPDQNARVFSPTARVQKKTARVPGPNARVFSKYARGATKPRALGKKTRVLSFGTRALLHRTRASGKKTRAFFRKARVYFENTRVLRQKTCVVTITTRLFPALPCMSGQKVTALRLSRSGPFCDPGRFLPWPNGGGNGVMRPVNTKPGAFRPTPRVLVLNRGWRPNTC